MKSNQKKIGKRLFIVSIIGISLLGGLLLNNQITMTFQKNNRVQLNPESAGSWTLNPFMIDDSGMGGNGTWAWYEAQPFFGGGRVLPVDSIGRVGDSMFIESSVLDSPFLRGLFDNLESLASTPKYYQNLKNDFINWFCTSRIKGTGGRILKSFMRYDYSESKSKNFYEGRLLIKEGIYAMLCDQVTYQRIAVDFNEEILEMVDRAKSTMDGVPEDQIIFRQIEIKRQQVIAYLVDYYTEVLANPQLHYDTSGYITLTVKRLLMDPSSHVSPVPFSYKATGINRHPFYDSFSLLFSLEYFDTFELSRILPTLAYSLKGETYNDLARSALFKAEIYHSIIKDSIESNFFLLRDYFHKYIEMDGSLMDGSVTISYFKERARGIDFESNIGHVRHRTINDNFLDQDIKDGELSSTYQTFKILNDDNSVNEDELSKMIANVLYYSNHYGANVRILDGIKSRSTSHPQNVRCVLAFSPNKLLESDYFTGTYSTTLALKKMDDVAVNLYYFQLSSLYSLSYFDSFSIINSMEKFPTIMLGGGESLRLRAMYDEQLLFVSSYRGDSMVEDLGYTTP
ncbi:MAG: hypothetical protein ACTSR8_11260 [Promethearchaeota archaeon]